MDGEDEEVLDPESVNLDGDEDAVPPLGMDDAMLDDDADPDPDRDH